MGHLIGFFIVLAAWVSVTLAIVAFSASTVLAKVQTCADAIDGKPVKKAVVEWGGFAAFLFCEMLFLGVSLFTMLVVCRYLFGAP